METQKKRPKFSTILAITLTVISLLASTVTAILIEAFESVTEPWVYISLIIVSIINAIMVVILVSWYGNTVENAIEDITVLSNDIWGYLGVRQLEHKKAREELTKWVNDAEEKIIACTYYIPSRKFNTQSYDGTKNKEKNDFATALRKKIIESLESKNFEFKRIYQFNDITSDFEEFKKDLNNNTGLFNERIQEFKLFYSEQNKNCEKFLILKSKIRINATFYLVDDKKMMIYVDTRSNELFDKPLAFALKIDHKNKPDFVKKLIETGVPLEMSEPIITID